MSKYRIFNYPGNKHKFVPQINELIKKAGDNKTFVEAFCGTASILINLEGDYKRKVINDHNPDIMRIIMSFRDGTFEDLAKMYEDVTVEFGNIKESKDAYYSFRDAYNLRYYHTDSVEKGFFLYMASRSAINSLFRTGPRGFNQSFGNRAGKLNLKKYEFDTIQGILKDTVFYCGDYFQVMDIYDNPDTLFFLDPPYVDRKVQGSYKDENAFNQDKFLERISKLSGNVIYTDVYSDYILGELNKSGKRWNFEVLSEKKNVSPGRNKGVKIDYVEVAYYNF